MLLFELSMAGLGLILGGSMKFKFLSISLVIMCCSISATVNETQSTSRFSTWLKKIKSSQIRSQSTQNLNTWLRDLKNGLVTYTKNSLPKTKKQWVLTIISEGIAEGILMFQGLKILSTYKQDRVESFIEKSQGFQGLFTGNLTEVERDKVEKDITSIIDEVVEKTGMKERVKVHYAPGVSGGFSYGKSHIFVPTQYGDSLLTPQTKEELAFITAHELGHIQKKDHLKFAAAAIAAPLITLAITKALDKATNIIIDELIKSMKLTNDRRGYKILTKFKAGKSRALRNPIVRYLIARSIFTAYNRYREKQADLFAAQHGYKEGGETFFERLDEDLSSFQKRLDRLHPRPAKRKRYLEQSNQ